MSLGQTVMFLNSSSTPTETCVLSLFSHDGENGFPVFPHVLCCGASTSDTTSCCCDASTGYESRLSSVSHPEYAQAWAAVLPLLRAAAPCSPLLPDPSSSLNNLSAGERHITEPKRCDTSSVAHTSPSQRREYSHCLK